MFLEEWQLWVMGIFYIASLYSASTVGFTSGLVNGIDKAIDYLEMQKIINVDDEGNISAIGEN
jgi:hypothetical protein